MKILIFSFISFFAIVTSNYFADDNQVKEITTEIVSSHGDEHHTCSGTSGLGGSCSGTCTDSQGCACSSGLFSCSCGCSTPAQAEVPAVAYDIDAGDEETWNQVARLLSSESNKEAQAIANDMPRVYKLSKTDTKSFLSEAEKLDERFFSLPNSITEKVFSHLDKKRK